MLPDRAQRLNYLSVEHQHVHFRAVRRYLPEGPKHLLDVGCGHGDFCQWLPSGYSYRGIDQNRNAIRTARRLYPGFEFSHSKRITDANVIVCIGSQISDPLTLIPELVSKCELFVMTVWNIAFFSDPGRESWLPNGPDVVAFQSDFVLLVKGNV